MTREPSEFTRAAGDAPYQVVREVGQGLSGTVYLARDVRRDRLVALKVLDRRSGVERTLERFAREAKLLSGHPHEALVPIVEARMDHSPPYLVLEWMEGGDLAERVREVGPVPCDDVFRVGIRLAAALAHLHSHGVLHRDVKLANVLLDEQGDAYLADLGLVRSADAQSLTATGYVVGTPRYMAPEIIEKGEYSDQSDHYALGVTLLEAVRGEPFGEMVTISDELQEELRKVPDPRLRRVLRWCTRTLPSARPARTEMLVRALAGLGEEEAPALGTTTVDLPVASTAILRRPRRRPPRLGALALVAALAVAFGWLGRRALDPAASRALAPGPVDATPVAGADGPLGPARQELDQALAALAPYSTHVESREGAIEETRDLRQLFEPFLDARLPLSWRRYLRTSTDWIAGLEHYDALHPDAPSLQTRTEVVHRIEGDVFLTGERFLMAFRDLRTLAEQLPLQDPRFLDTSGPLIRRWRARQIELVTRFERLRDEHAASSSPMALRLLLAGLEGRLELGDPALRARRLLEWLERQPRSPYRYLGARLAARSLGQALEERHLSCEELAPMLEACRLHVASRPAQSVHAVGAVRDLLVTDVRVLFACPAQAVAPRVRLLDGTLELLEERLQGDRRGLREAIRTLRRVAAESPRDPPDQLERFLARAGARAGLPPAPPVPATTR